MPVLGTSGTQHGAKTANFSCVNSGQIDADPANIGATAWCYQSQKGNWGYSYCGGGNLHNGWWQMSGESDLALFGALRLISSDVANDPVFGLFGYGCDVTDAGTRYGIVPHDGIFKRLNMVSLKMSLLLEQDQYSAATIGKSKNYVEFTLRNMKTAAHTTKVSVAGLPAGNFDVLVDNVRTGTFAASAGVTSDVLIAVGTAVSYNIKILPQGTVVRGSGGLKPPQYTIGIAPVKNGLRIDYCPSMSNAKSPSLAVFGPQGERLGFRGSIPAGRSLWKPGTGSLGCGIYIVRITWPDGGSELKTVLFAR
jgi:hypothetical protein